MNKQAAGNPAMTLLTMGGVIAITYFLLTATTLPAIFSGSMTIASLIKNPIIIFLILIVFALWATGKRR